MKKIMTLLLVAALMMVGTPMIAAAADGAAAGAKKSTPEKPMGQVIQENVEGTAVVLATAGAVALFIANAASNDENVVTPGHTPPPSH